MYDSASNETMVSGTIFDNYAKLFLIKFSISEERKSILDDTAQKINSDPMTAEMSEQFHKRLGVRLNNSSNAIEGLDLTLSQTELILENEIVALSPEKIIDVVGHEKAHKVVLRILKENRDLTIEDVLKINNSVLSGGDNAGCFRKPGMLARIRGRRVVTAHPVEIPGLMQKIVDYFNDRAVHVLDRLVNFHVMFVRVHPFVDGNGRTVRLLLALLSLRSDYGLFMINKNKRVDYFDAIAAWEDDCDTEKMGALFYQSMLEVHKIYTDSLRCKCVLA
ncbi:hypothetical protein AKO1_007211 [Acrasis kona]|uniref:Fido domain-containing protein n=1 Tax=Acrasis kona TaxID=1008807 RepID=A0AAW2YSL2_9EUKA